MRILFSILLLYITSSAFSNSVHKISETDSLKKSLRSEINYPIPGEKINKLFYLQRTSNTNTIVYELNTGNDGKLDIDYPVNAYWIRYAEKGQKQELNYIQRKFAYGLTAKALGNDKYDIRFVSYKKFPLTLMKSSDGKYHIFAVIAQKQVMLNRIFVKIEGGSFWLPNVLYVEVKGTDPVTGREIMERFKP